ncbi:MAG: ABC transporter ATP-binding protein [Phycisphaeraceae bacterium]
MTPIQIRNLSKHFGPTVAVAGIDLDIAAGELFFLLGPSGCGKTTLLRCLAGFIDPTGGRIRFGERDVTHLPTNKRNTGMVFQGYALWPHMTVAQNVAFGLEVRKVRGQAKADRVAAALEMVQMSPYAGRRPNALSGGQQQRVALARALVIEPTVLLLDEPLSNLDAKLRGQMRSQIREICKRTGITAVYVTHDQKEALSMADRIAVMDEGKLMQVGSPRELYDRPANRFVADFLGETNFIRAKVAFRADGALTLDTPMGPVRSTTFPDKLDAETVTCSIRPEALSLDGDGQARPGANVFETSCDDVTYLGEMAQYHLAAAGDARLIVYELHPRWLQRQGQAVRVQVDPADVVVLED